MAKKRTRRGGNTSVDDSGGGENRDSNRSTDSGGSQNNGGGSNNNGSGSNNNGGGSNNNGGGSGGGGGRRRRRRSGGGGGGSNNSRRRRSGGGGNNSGGNRNNNNRSRRQNREPVEFDDAELVEGTGLLEMHPNGYGFLRSKGNNYSREQSDPFVPGTMIEKFGLRAGLMLSGKVQPGRRQQGPRLRELTDIDGLAPEKYPEIKSFDQLTPINPEQRYTLETGATPLTTRVMDLLLSLIHI